jgi:hypothetical protein
MYSFLLCVILLPFAISLRDSNTDGIVQWVCDFCCFGSYNGSIARDLADSPFLGLLGRSSFAWHLLIQWIFLGKAHKRSILETSRRLPFLGSPGRSTFARSTANESVEVASSLEFVVRCCVAPVNCDTPRYYCDTVSDYGTGILNGIDVPVLFLKPRCDVRVCGVTDCDTSNSNFEFKSFAKDKTVRHPQKRVPCKIFSPFRPRRQPPSYQHQYLIEKACKSFLKLTCTREVREINRVS